MANNARGPLSPGAARRSGKLEQKSDAPSPSERKLAADEILQVIGELREKANNNNLKLIAYLLDLAALEALDYRKSFAKSAQGQSGEQI